MKKIQAGILIIILIMANIAGIQAIEITPSDEGAPKQEVSIYLNPLQHLYQILKNLFSTVRPLFQPAPKHSTPLPTSPIIHSAADSNFDYVASSPYYKASFKGVKTRINVPEGWIEFNLKENRVKAGEMAELESNKERVSLTNSSTVSENKLSVSDVFEATDLDYVVETSILHEILVLKQYKSFDRIISEISWDGLTPEFQEDGSILFSGGKPVLRIFPPTMTDALGNICNSLHYELIQTKTGYELHKVIDEEGLEWLRQAQYPVKIDPTMETFEDAWETSGFQPYGQYFQDMEGTVGILNGHLSITQADLAITGRGLDLVISRTYETPAIFHQAEPYDYTPPPTEIGKGWRLNFPYISDDYIYLMGGGACKIKWVDNIFENHAGNHFILVKNADSTYAMTVADGTVFKFNTEGKPTQIIDKNQNTITFNYNDGVIISITDTIGRVVTFSYSDGFLKKIIYNGSEIEYGYDSNGNLIWADDFLDRRTYYSYDSDWWEWVDGVIFYKKENVYLLSKVVFPTGGYITYDYDRFSYEEVYGDDGTSLDYFKYYVTDQKVYETDQVRHLEYSYYGNFLAFTDCVITIKNEADVIQGYHDFDLDVSNGLITQRTVKNASNTVIRKLKYTYNSRKEIIKAEAYSDGLNLSYSGYFAYDDWGNLIYVKNAEGHEQFFSYANTSTSGFFMDDMGSIIQNYTNAFTNSDVPSSVHTALLGQAEKQDGTFVKELYLAYDSEGFPTQQKSMFGNYTSWLSFSGTFNEKTSALSFPIDLADHAVVGNAVLVVTGIPSDDTYAESKSTTCHSNPTIKCIWNDGYWSSKYYSVMWSLCDPFGECDFERVSIGPFTHRPGTLGYQSYTTNPSLGDKSNSFSVTTYWKAYPVQVQYNLDGAAWETITANLMNGTTRVAVPTTDGLHTLNFSESSSQNTKFSWTLFVPVDNSPDSFITNVTFDTYGNTTSVTDHDGATITMSYSPEYSYAYRTEMSATVGSDIITNRATYDYYRGWMTSRTNPDGAEYLYSYDVLGRITKKEYPLLAGQFGRSYEEAIYDDVNRTVTLIDTLRHYGTRHFDKLGRTTTVNAYSGTYGSGTLYATTLVTYRYDDNITAVVGPQGQAYTFSYDSLGRCIQKTLPDSTTASYLFDDTNNRVTLTNPNGFDRIAWYDWCGRLLKLEEEYADNSFAVTTYQYNEFGQLVAFTDAGDHCTNYIYESTFGLTKKILPDSTYEEYEYNNTGGLISFKNREGSQTLITYDDIGRTTQIRYRDQSAISFAYDLNSNMTKVIDDSPNIGDFISYEYDAWNRPIVEARHISSQISTISADYNTASQLTRLTYPDGMEILYFYNDTGGIAEIKRYVDGINDETLVQNTQYNNMGLLTQLDYGNGLRANYSYDARERVSTIELRNGENLCLDIDYTYDNNSNITQIVNNWRDTQLNWNSQTEYYAYDGLNRLTSADNSSWSHTYSYDKLGNRISKDGITYTVNTMGEVTALSDGTTFAYNGIGSITEKIQGSDSWTYAYDAVNQLTIVKKNDEVLGEYVYDGYGRRIQVSESGEITAYMYFGRSILYKEDSAGKTSFIYGPVGKIAERRTSNGESHTFYYHTDLLGSTRLVTDENANILATVTYHPFGEIDVQEGSEDNLFSGKEKDATDLYYFGARYYDAELGRFLTVDPVPGSPNSSQSMNRYSYCMNNPVSYTDPWGERTDIPADVREFNYKRRKQQQKESSAELPSDFGSITHIKRCLDTIDNFDCFEIVGPDDEGWPGWIFTWGGEEYRLYSPIIKHGNVGVAMGGRRTGEVTALPVQQDSSGKQFYTFVPTEEEGILIFLFDDEGNIVDVHFLPIKDIGEDLTKQSQICYEVYTHCGDQLKDFWFCLDGLEAYVLVQMGDLKGAKDILDKLGKTGDVIERFIELGDVFSEVFTVLGWVDDIFSDLIEMLMVWRDAIDDLQDYVVTLMLE